MESVELSMIAVDEDRSSTRRFELLSERVLAIAGIYGPNASGKSNILEALAWLSAAVRRSIQDWTDFVPREPFRFGQGPTAPSIHEIEMIVNGVRYAYRLEVDDASIVFEGLYNYPERRRRVLFEREGMSLRFRRGLSGMSGTRELLTPTTLALSAAMRFDEHEIRSFGRALASIDDLGISRHGRPKTGGHPYSDTWMLFAQRVLHSWPAPSDEPGLDVTDDSISALALLRFADLGIDDVQLVESEEDRAWTAQTPGVARAFQLRLVHRVAEQELPFALEEESAGTQTWFTLIGPTLRALRTGRILLVDEIDASLHPRLSVKLLELFQAPQTNPHGAQLIFTTHDTSLLNHLNRDEVWLTEKGDDGAATTLTALAEYGGDKVRRSLNLEKAYLQGRFGAVPEFDQHVLRRALGLETGGT